MACTDRMPEQGLVSQGSPPTLPPASVSMARARALRGYSAGPPALPGLPTACTETLRRVPASLMASMDIPLAPGETVFSASPMPRPATRTAYLDRLPANLELECSVTPRTVKRQASSGKPSSGLGWAVRPVPHPEAPRTACGATVPAPAVPAWPATPTLLLATQTECTD